MAKIAFLFPGQGAQYVGMGREFYDRFPAARHVFDQAAASLGEGLITTIFSGPAEELQRTENTQPAILTVSTAIYRVLAERGVKAEAMAGLSLGEYSALVASGALSFEEALPLVRKRGRWMQEAVPPGRGTMVALMGLSKEQVEEICLASREAGVVSPANYNCPGQIVISGEVAAVNQAAQLAREKGAKKVTELKVSAPFHCSLLAPVEEKMARELEAVTLRPPAVPVIFNVSAAFAAEPSQIRANLVRQVSRPILWEQSMQALLEAGYDTFIEVGPGKTLSKLMKRMASDVYLASVEDCESLEALLAHLKKGADSDEIEP